ncbi:unnamed protein product [Cylicocyclus nassatus]|uniref:Leishmanolysin-like peptidase n=1 Tax=Cylicocyclus nassatus TaxID=53992 RepID=A0AA36HAK8_CYLNA|nr:unnamed protein product [Cylicocyclus nassatus]
MLLLKTAALCAFVNICTFQYIPLSIVIIRPSRFIKLDTKIEEGLRSAIHNLSKIVSILDYGQRKITRGRILKCLPTFKDIESVEVTENGVDRIMLFERFTLATRGFVILLQNDKKKCRKPTTLASAKPCGVDSKRPLMGLLNVCTGRRWSRFFAGVDLFRHELLHSLGFGMILPATSYQRGPHSVIYNWTHPWSMTSKSLAKRQFLDFSGKALREARMHFGCDTLAGIEADTANKIHLNEYIYGNELMTPNLSNVSNPFSYISAAILEETYLGDKQWYRINRLAIRAEHDALWYGKGWGCTFAERSCFEFIAERLRTGRSTFPFCSQRDYEQDRQTKYKVKLSSGQVKSYKESCWLADVRRDIADNGLLAYTLSEKSYSSLNHRIGSTAAFRFCPVASVTLSGIIR